MRIALRGSVEMNRLQFNGNPEANNMPISLQPAGFTLKLETCAPTDIKLTGEHSESAARKVSR